MVTPLLITMALICRADFNDDGIVNNLDTGTFVAAFGQGCVTEPTLNWTNPTLNTDGTALTDLSHIMVYWTPGGTAGTNVGIATSYVVSGLDINLIYQFWVTAVDDAGNESDNSESVFWP